MNPVSAENSRAAVKQFPKFESDLMSRKQAAAVWAKFWLYPHVSFRPYDSFRRYSLIEDDIRASMFFMPIPYCLGNAPHDQVPLQYLVADYIWLLDPCVIMNLSLFALCR